MALPIYKTDSKDFQLMQNAWAQQLNPVINLGTNKGIILQNVSLISGTNVVNHLLGRRLQGWHLVRQRALAQIYDEQDMNQMPNLTLTLISSAPVIVDIFVF